MKTNNKHAKGPWKVHFRELTGQYHINFNGKNKLMDDTDFNANAALIAAAPEMFEMLQDILKETDDAVWISRINQIIKKAKGE